MALCIIEIGVLCLRKTDFALQQALCNPSLHMRVMSRGSGTSPAVLPSKYMKEREEKRTYLYHMLILSKGRSRGKAWHGGEMFPFSC